MLYPTFLVITGMALVCSSLPGAGSVWLLLTLFAINECTNADDVISQDVYFSHKSEPAFSLEGRDSLRDVSQLALCDCYHAEGNPGGLTCEKEGFFLADFEHVGSWMLGGGMVPLSRGLCCRPCLPSRDTLPPSLPDFDADPPVAMVSVGCHTASGRGGRSVACEYNADSGFFATGFANGAPISGTDPLYFPYAPVECCTPALLTESGRAFRVRRCGCTYTSGKVGCDAPASGQAIAAYGGTRHSRAGDLVPVAPVECCGMCVGEEVPSSGGCEALKGCNGNGTCRLGVCECYAGYGGPDCKYALRDGTGGFWSLPAWVLLGIFLGGFSALSFIVAIVARIFVDSDGFRRMPWNDTASDEGMERPLLRFGDDDTGSVGSEDTCAEEDELASATSGWGGSVHRLGEEAWRSHVLEGSREGRPGDDADYYDGEHHEDAMSLEEASQRGGEPNDGEEYHSDGSMGAEAMGPGEEEYHSDGSMGAEAMGSGEEREGRRRGTDWGDAASTGEREDAAPRNIGVSGGGGVVSESVVSAGGTPRGSVGEGEGGEEEEEWGLAGEREGDGEEGEEWGLAGEREGDGEEEGEEEGEYTPQGSVASIGEEGGTWEAVEGEDGEPGTSRREVEEERMREREREREKPAGLVGRDCVICYEKPIQVALVPCGHTVMCRRCSRRMDACPICRKDIVRRQKLYIPDPDDPDHEGAF